MSRIILNCFSLAKFAAQLGCGSPFTAHIIFMMIRVVGCRAVGTTTPCLYIAVARAVRDYLIVHVVSGLPGDGNCISRPTNDSGVPSFSVIAACHKPAQSNVTTFHQSGDTPG